MVTVSNCPPIPHAVLPVSILDGRIISCICVMISSNEEIQRGGCDAWTELSCQFQNRRQLTLVPVCDTSTAFQS